MNHHGKTDLAVFLRFERVHLARMLPIMTEGQKNTKRREDKMSQKDYYDIGRAINQFIQDLKNAPVGGFTNVKNGVDEAARQFKDEVKNAAKGFKLEINPGARTQPKEPPRSNQQWNSQGASTNSWQKPAVYRPKAPPKHRPAEKAKPSPKP